jgi:DNA polymerase III delta prime subunit
MQINKNKNKLWVEKHRPSTLDGYIFHDETHEKFIRSCIHNQDIPHLLLVGAHGAGKTTIARILITELGIEDSDVLIINASNERGLDTFRDRILSFISTYPTGKFKVVLLEEADQLPLLTQNVLRAAIEDFSETSRFILTGNYSNKISGPIKSRLQTLNFKAPDKNEVLMRVADILEDENIEYSGKPLKSIVDVFYPDIRKIINTIQQNSTDGTLTGINIGSVEGDWKFSLLDYIQSDDWKGARKLICTSVSSQDEWDEIYRLLYENINQYGKFQNEKNWDTAIVIIAEHLYKNAIVADCEINMASCLIKLGQI